MSNLSRMEQLGEKIEEIVEVLDVGERLLSEAYGLSVLCGLQPAITNRLQTKMRAVGYLREQVAEVREMAKGGLG